MTRNYVFVQRDIAAVKSWQITVSVCLHIDIKMIGQCLILAGMKGCQVCGTRGIIIL